MYGGGGGEEWEVPGTGRSRGERVWSLKRVGDLPKVEDGGGGGLKFESMDMMGNEERSRGARP